MVGKNFKSGNPMIFLGVGANLSTEIFGPPRRTCGAALEALGAFEDVEIGGVSSWWESAPTPISDQPWYVNAVVALKAAPEPEDLMARLLDLEEGFGRRRAERNAARVLDMDIVDYDGRVSGGDPVLPHPRAQGRAFVVLPLQELAPGWRHPESGASIRDLANTLPQDQEIRRMDAAGGFLGTEWSAKM